MEPSEEIRRVVERWIIAIAERDADAALGRLSENPDALIIGTDPAEWWHGQEARALWRRQLEELGPSSSATWEVPEKVEAWEEGTVGWASLSTRVTSGERSFDARLTCVLHLERGEWKLVQVHWSLPTPNVEAWGGS
jgi:ketosteroid isomerase-like protein